MPEGCLLNGPIIHISSKPFINGIISITIYKYGNSGGQLYNANHRLYVLQYDVPYNCASSMDVI